MSSGVVVIADVTEEFLFEFIDIFELVGSDKFGLNDLEEGLYFSVGFRIIEGVYQCSTPKLDRSISTG
jgi:hypothetical protein